MYRIINRCGKWIAIESGTIGTASILRENYFFKHKRPGCYTGDIIDVITNLVHGDEIVILVWEVEQFCKAFCVNIDDIEIKKLDSMVKKKSVDPEKYQINLLNLPNDAHK